MRTFSCLTVHRTSAAPALSFILARDEHRATELARRELITSRQALSVELREGGKLLWTRTA